MPEDSEEEPKAKEKLSGGGVQRPRVNARQASPPAAPAKAPTQGSAFISLPGERSGRLPTLNPRGSAHPALPSRTYLGDVVAEAEAPEAVRAELPQGGDAGCAAGEAAGAVSSNGGSDQSVDVLLCRALCSTLRCCLCWGEEGTWP